MKCSRTIFSRYRRNLHRHVQVIYENPDMFDRMKRARAVWPLAKMSFNNVFSRDNSGKQPRKMSAKGQSFTAELAQRIEKTQIECGDVLNLIRSVDTRDTFFYNKFAVCWIRAGTLQRSCARIFL